MLLQTKLLLCMYLPCAGGLRAILIEQNQPLLQKGFTRLGKFKKFLLEDLHMYCFMHMCGIYMLKLRIC